MSATDDGVYSLGENVDRLDDPVTINGRQIELFRDRELFFGTHDHHHHSHFLHGNFTVTSFHFGAQFKDEQFITDPTLAIGTSNAARVKHSDFDYRIDDFSFSKSSSEIVLTGSAIPAGLFCLYGICYGN